MRYAITDRVLQLAQKHDLLIVENDPLADFKPTALPRLAALDQLERTIYIGSFSKSFSAALRVGFVACGADLASDLAGFVTGQMLVVDGGASVRFPLLSPGAHPSEALT